MTNESVRYWKLPGIEYASGLGYRMLKLPLGFHVLSGLGAVSIGTDAVSVGFGSKVFPFVLRIGKRRWRVVADEVAP